MFETLTGLVFSQHVAAYINKPVVSVTLTDITLGTTIQLIVRHFHVRKLIVSRFMDPPEMINMHMHDVVCVFGHVLLREGKMESLSMWALTNHSHHALNFQLLTS